MVDQDKLKAFGEIAAGDWRLSRMIDRCTANTYDVFIELLYQDIDNVISEMQLSKSFLCGKSEDEITVTLVRSLKQLTYQADHDPMKNGHVDFFVEGRQPDFHWMGEAKKDSGAATLEGGLRQLCDRYSTGAHQQNHGGILVYIDGKKAALIFKRWREHLESLDDQESFENLSVTDCPTGNPLRFQTEHIHSSSGLPYKVRHMGLALYHSPTDA